MRDVFLINSDKVKEYIKEAPVNHNFNGSTFYVTSDFLSDIDDDKSNLSDVFLDIFEALDAYAPKIVLGFRHGNYAPTEKVRKDLVEGRLHKKTRVIYYLGDGVCILLRCYNHTDKGMETAIFDNAESILSDIKSECTYVDDEQEDAAVWGSILAYLENNYIKLSDDELKILKDYVEDNNIKSIYDIEYKLKQFKDLVIFDNPEERKEYFTITLNEKLNEARAQSAVKSNGIFSVMNNEWIKEPVKEDIPEVDQDALNKELGKWVDRYIDIVGDKEKSLVDVLESISDTKVYNYCGPVYRSGKVFKKNWCGYAEATTLDRAIKDLIERIVIEFNLRNYDDISINRSLIKVGNSYLSEEVYIPKSQREKMAKEKAIQDAIIKLADDDIKKNIALGYDEYKVFEVLCKELGIEPNKYLFDLYLQRIADRYTFGEYFKEDLENEIITYTIPNNLKQKVIDELKQSSSLESVLNAYFDNRYTWLAQKPEEDKSAFLNIVDTVGGRYVIGGQGFGLKLSNDLFKEIVDNVPLNEEQEKIRFYYSGPVYNFEHVLRNPWSGYTEAVSKKQALNNLKAKFKTEFYGRPDVWKKIDLDPKYLEVSPKHPEDDIDWENVKSKYCPECGAPLNDAGECPNCDLGDRTALEESYEDDKITEIENYIEDIYDLRKTSIAEDGEYGIGNLVFKEIRNLGYLDNLKELKNVLKSKKFSLKEKLK